MCESVNKVATFILKLWKMLHHEESANIISWSTSGLSFVIHNQVLFMTKLLPMYFKHNNLGSFVRQLNLYDFHKIYVSKNTTSLEYYHQYFQRDRPDFLTCIKRKLSPNKGLLYTINSEELINLKKNQDKMFKKLNMIQLENKALLKAVARLQVQNNRQNKVLKKVEEIVDNYKTTYSHCKAKNFEWNPSETKKIDFSGINNSYATAQYSFPNEFTTKTTYQDDSEISNSQLPQVSIPENNFLNKVNSFMNLKNPSPVIDKSVPLSEGYSDQDYNNNGGVPRDVMISLDNVFSNLIEIDPFNNFD